ncbi:MAG: bifunctional diaminohydroxyphosphoribosylaminopyrimidine deaminase/5-amino-6-(5-phosphoribosylamino)uracil reductase RibD, partial [Hyphomicrobiales bacterium]|nr:bifunctional diaminohydroxyphosphoribosylaminopyrimidine deaminase/5-amino-6-(5-phosphoribosylamino)uracil reductase RibD [Hyphomicrobiales bacterium]
MAEALALGRARLGRTGANPAVGALVVADGKVVGRGATEEGGRPHAEPLALAQAGPRSKGATLYVTLEPCAHHGRAGPCAEAIVAAGIARVVSAMEDPDPRMRGAGHALLRDAGVAVEIGAGAAEAAYDHRGHVSRVTEGRPLVTLKLARTADGFAAGPPGASRLKITGAEAEARVHGLRATHDAILVGGATALA